MGGSVSTNFLSYATAVITRIMGDRKLYVIAGLSSKRLLICKCKYNSTEAFHV